MWAPGVLLLLAFSVDSWEVYVRERDTHTDTYTWSWGMYVCETHTHTHTSFWLFSVVSLVFLFLPSPCPLHRCPPQLLRCQPPPSPGGPEFPAEPSLLEVPSSSHLIGLHLPHQPHLHVDTLLSCLGSDPALSCLTPWAQAWRCCIA